MKLGYPGQAVALVFSSLCVLIAGCASMPQDSTSLVEAYRGFLMDVEKPFPRRAKDYLGLQVETDPASMKINGFTRFEPVHGRAIYYAVVRLASAQPPLYLATMTTSFDPSIACIRRSDFAVWGQIRPGMPVFNHHAVAGGDLRVAAPGQEPDDLTLVTSRGPVTIYLMEFDKGCLKEIRHTVQMLKQ